MKRILIIGNAGAGKSTFARALSQKLQLPLIHLDRLYWQGNWEHCSREEFNIVLQQELEKDCWIIDGNFNRTMPHRLSYCDTVFFFDLPTITCLWGITRRIFQHYGKTRQDMGGNCPERFDRQKWSLYRNVIGFNRKHQKDYCKLLAQQNNVQCYVFKSHADVKAFLATLEQ